MSGPAVAVIVAAGRGSRFGGALPKQYQLYRGRPLLRHAIEAFISHPAIAGVLAVIREEDRARYSEAVGGLALPPPVIGGETRQASVRAGLEALADRPPAQVLIHDGARPQPSPALITRIVDALSANQGAIPALPVTDSLKQAGPDGLVQRAVPREGLWRVQTPQGFHFQAILQAHRGVAAVELTDDAAVAEAAGLAVRLVEGEEANIKVTHEADMSRLAGNGGAEPDIRTGTGFDVHRFGAGDHVTLCGLRLPHNQGLEGHSDADVGLHALTDALLGAIADGDIGSHFPPADPRWRGADSAVFLGHAASLVRAHGGRILHLDLTLICERPKVGPHRQAMRERVAAIAGVDVSRVSVKATTTEGLGFTGRREGIAAQASATVRLESA